MQVLIGKTGKENLKRRVTDFQVSKLRIDIARKAKQLVRRFNVDDVRSVSAGAATFYVWVRVVYKIFKQKILQQYFLLLQCTLL